MNSHLDVTEQLDYEGELAVIISKSGSHISKEHALDHIFGYTIVNDITARDLQKKHKQFFIGKSLDTTCPMGPVIVHKLMYNDRAHRACRIQAFADKKLLMFFLQIARCYIIYNCIAEYMIKRMFFGDVRSAF